MFLVKALFGKVWNDPNSAEIATIQQGAFYIVRPDSVKGSRECIFNNAMATIRRVLSHDYQFQLVITRVFEEGEEQLLDEEDELSHERAFLIDEALQFRSGKFEGDSTFLWRDLESPEDLFEFVATGVNSAMLVFFETAMYKAMYERKYSRGSESVEDADIQQFIYIPESKPKTSRKASSSQPQPTSPPRSHIKSQPTSPPGSRIKSQSAGTTFDAVPGSGTVVLAVPAKFFLWTEKAGGFEEQEENSQIHAQLVKEGQFNFWIRVQADNSYILGHVIGPSLNFRAAPGILSFSWTYTDHGQPSTWAFRFETLEVFETWGAAFGQALWEATNGQSMDKLKPDEREYILTAHKDIEMKDEDDEDQVEDALLEEEDEGAESEEEIELQVEDSDNSDAPRMTSRSKNKQLVVGTKNNRSYVVRGNAIGVFKHTEDHKLSHAGTVDKVATLKGKAFSPKKVMLHNQDASMILMKDDDPHTLYRMDLDRGKVVEEWHVHDDISVNEIAPDSKFAQTTAQQTLVGTSHNALFRIDPRLSGQKLVDSEYKQYASKNGFTSIATTASGRLAVGSTKGELRLFDTVGKNAKTALPPLGDPILGVDVTADGRWVVATCRTYLLLIDTLIGDGRYKGNLGFDRSFPAESKPQPRRLQLKPEHVAYMGSNMSFSPARFNTGPDKAETAIVTSCGRFVVAWNFAKVKTGHLYAYEIKQYDDTVVQDEFKFGDDKDIIVALSNNVVMVDKKSLKRPTRQSLGRSAIVKSAF